MDYKYWNEYYSKQVAPKQPSKFAMDIMMYLEKDKKMVELGCGNGRDSIFFSESGVDVIAIDQSDASIQILNNNNYNDKIEFISDDFIRTNILKNEIFDYAYSRFTIHSILEEEEDILVKRVHDALKYKGLFFIEVRSIKDDIYGLGTNIGRNIYVYNEHRRRFIVIDELVEKLKSAGFNIIFANESNNYAIYKDQNPIVIRIIAQKQ
jgi:SAM-dependent methyltransferase